MMHLTKGTLALVAAFSLSLRPLVPAQPAAWEMDTKVSKQRQIGEIRTRTAPRMNTRAKGVKRKTDQPAISIRRPSVIEFGPLRDTRTPAPPQAPKKR